MNNNHVEFRGMTPDTELREYARNQMNRVMSLAPLGAACVAVLAKSNRVYRCSMDICSRSGPVLVRAESSSARLAIEGALKKAEEKLLRWQERRFEKSRTYVSAANDESATQQSIPAFAGTA